VTAAEFLATDTVVPWPRREPETVLSRPFTQAHIAVGTHGCGVPDGHGFRGGGALRIACPSIIADSGPNRCRTTIPEIRAVSALCRHWEM